MESRTENVMRRDNKAHKYTEFHVEADQVIRKMVERDIEGVSVNFPFEPYDVQHAFMSKVIVTLNSGTNAVLESPTGTGKTLSLLCSTLAWVSVQKRNLQAQLLKAAQFDKDIMGFSPAPRLSGRESGAGDEIKSGSAGGRNWMVPKVIYASRTHSQLTQAAQEMKRTAYASMKATVLGSRDQLCIHPEVIQETNNASKVQMCKLRVTSRQCTFYTRVESHKNHPDLLEQPIMDIEDLVVVGRKLKMCPYYASKELVTDADIIFMPYNYLLDPSVRKSNKIELAGSIIILDEAHNIEKICEEYTSTQIKSSDLALAIEDATHIMKAMSSSSLTDAQDMDDDSKDFTLDDVARFKEILLLLESVIDDIRVDNEVEGTTYPASFVYEMLEMANINYGSCRSLLAFCEKLVQFAAMESQQSSIRKGGSFQRLADFLSIVFISKEDVMEKVYKCFKVHVEVENTQNTQTNNRNNAESSRKDGWMGKNTSTTSHKKPGRVINYWCFNPGFGMEQLLNARVRSIILTSGTLAPLKPFIAELSLPVYQELENPHIISSSQVFVRIIGNGPDREPLISNYQNRDNPKYIKSLGSTVLNVARVVPDGLLVFFPSYPMLNQCIEAWQSSGLWADLMRFKPIFIEPRGKNNFNAIIQDFYASIKCSKGGCFMAVCRGKVSEGLDFADRNGRAVIITGLPFPPLKDPKIVLKKRYLDENRTKQNELLTGQAWYALEATRAVNQAIGRVIRHRNDYGAILLCDMRFQQSSQVQQLSKWIRNILGNSPKSTQFGPVVKELRNFFKATNNSVAKPIERVYTPVTINDEVQIVKTVRPSITVKLESTNQSTQSTKKMSLRKSNTIESWTALDYANATGHATDANKLPNAMDFISRLGSNSAIIDFNLSNVSRESEAEGKKDQSAVDNATSPEISPFMATLAKRKKYKLTNLLNIDTTTNSASSSSSVRADESTTVCLQQGSNKLTDKLKMVPEDRVDFLKLVRETLPPEAFTTFTEGLIAYKNNNNIDQLIELLLKVFNEEQLTYILKALRRFVKTEHRPQFDQRFRNFGHNI